ncbi:MAG: MBL fold metallo-hydrolase [Anaerolineae bacterium]
MKHLKEALRIDETPVTSDLDSVISQADEDDVARCWWLGQAGFALKSNGRLLLIDPYLSDSLAKKYRTSEFKHLRMMPIPIAPETIHDCDWYLCTHGHTDHMDAATIRGVLQASSPEFLVPRAEMEKAKERGVPVDRLHGINAGETVVLSDNLVVEAVASAHERLDTDANGNHKFLGYIISLGELRLYHSGDCIPYPGLADTLAAKDIDIAFLPINGRDDYRLSKGVPGNFTVDEAIALCHAADIGYLVGHHFGLFDFNTIDRGDAEAVLREQAGELGCLLPEIGVTYALSRGGRERP